MGVGLIGYIF
jgi:hypothetical protein